MLRLIENFFTRPMAEVATIPRENPAARLAEADAALRRAEAEFQIANCEYDAAKAAVRAWQRQNPQLDVTRIYNGAAYTIVNQHRITSPTLNELCARREKARMRFAEALRVRADLMRELKSS